MRENPSGVVLEGFSSPKVTVINKQDIAIKLSHLRHSFALVMNYALSFFIIR